MIINVFHWIKLANHYRKFVFQCNCFISIVFFWRYLKNRTDFKWGIVLAVYFDNKYVVENMYYYNCYNK